MVVITRIASQDAKGTSGTTSVSATYAATATAGHLLIAVIFANAGTITLTGWTHVAGSPQLHTGSGHVALMYKLAAGTEGTITATATSATSMKIHIYEYQGNANPIALDGTPSGNTSDPSTVTSKATPNITTLLNGSLVIAAIAQSAAVTSLTWSNGFTDGQHDTSVKIFDASLIASPGVQSTTASWTTSSVAATLIAGFAAAPLGLPFPPRPPRPNLMRRAA